jgi:flagellar hook-basal body complex protein FliE
MLPIGSIGPIGQTAAMSAVRTSGALTSAPPAAGLDVPADSAALGTAGTSGSPGGSAGLGLSGQSFVNTLGDALKSLNDQLSHADASMADFASGGSSDLHTVMLEMQEAAIGLKVGIQVRDRLLEAYQEIMRLQI